MQINKNSTNTESTHSRSLTQTRACAAGCHKGDVQDMRSKESCRYRTISTIIHVTSCSAVTFLLYPSPSSAGSNLSDTPTEVRWMVRVRKLWDVTSRQVTSRWCKWGGVGGVGRGVTRYKGGKWMQWEAHKTVWRHQTAGSTRLFTNDFCDVTRSLISRIIINASALGCSSGNVKGRLSPEQN